MATAPSATIPDTSGDLDCVIVAQITVELPDILTDLNALTNDDGDFLTDDDGVQIVQG